MDCKIKDFVAVYENAFSSEYCDKVVENFELCIDAGMYAIDRQSTDGVTKMLKEDEQLFGPDVFANPIQGHMASLSGDLGREFVIKFWGDIYPTYASQFAILNDHEEHGIYNTKLQKTKPGQGYHVWHTETSDRAVSNRILSWILYLNDIEEGGETEFLYIGQRVKPKKGTFVMWPAGFTHTHRGNPPLAEDKYIYTGWVEF